MTLELTAIVTSEDIAEAFDSEPAELYLMLAELALSHHEEDGSVAEQERENFLSCWIPPSDHLLRPGNIAAGHAVNRLLQEMTKELSIALLAAEKERRRHAS